MKKSSSSWFPKTSLDRTNSKVTQSSIICDMFNLLDRKVPMANKVKQVRMQQKNARDERFMKVICGDDACVLSVVSKLSN